MSDIYGDLYLDDGGTSVVRGANSITVRVDWDDDGDFNDVIDDVTADIRPLRSPITLQYGRDPGGAAPTTAGSGGMVLDNTSRRYSPRNTLSPLYGKIQPYRPVKIVRTIDGTPYTLFQGHTDETPINPDINARSVDVSLVDHLAGFRGRNITTGLHQGIRTGEAVSLVLDAVGWTGGRDLDPGATVMPWWWEEDGDALTALNKIVQSEGFPAIVTIGADGAVIFRDRFHRRTRIPSIVSQGTWRSTGAAEPVMSTGVSYDDSWAGIVNSAAVMVDIRTLGSQTIWESTDLITMEYSSSLTIPISTSDMFTAAQPLLSGVSSSMPGLSATPPTLSLSRTTGTSAILTLTTGPNPGVPAGTKTIISPGALRVVADVLTVTSQVRVSASDAVSIDKHREREFTGELPWCGVGDAQAILDAVVAQRKDPVPAVTARFVLGRNQPRCAALLSRDISDRVHVVEPESAVDADFHIERITHSLTGEDDHEMTFTLELCPDGPSVFVLDSQLLDSGALG